MCFNVKLAAFEIPFITETWNLWNKGQMKIEGFTVTAL